MDYYPKKDRSLTGKLGAIRMAEIIGCSGAHQDKNGKWNPCASPEELDKISRAAEPPKRKTALSEVESWQKARISKGKKKKKKEWLKLGERSSYGIGTTTGGGLVSINTPSGVGSGIQSGPAGITMAGLSPDEEKALTAFSPRDNDVDVFTDIESARARSRQLGCIGVSRRVSKTGRTVWMPCTNMSDYSRLTGTTSLGRRHQQEQLKRTIRTVLRDDLTKLRRKKSIFEELNGFTPETKEEPVNEAPPTPSSEDQRFLDTTRSYMMLPKFVNPCGPGFYPVRKRKNNHGKFVQHCVPIGKKSLGRGIGRSSSEPFDPNARDADGDGFVQEGTPFKRPAIPQANIQKPVRGMNSGQTGPWDTDPEHLKRVKRKHQLDWASRSRTLPPARQLIEKYERDKNSFTEDDYKKLDNVYKKYGPERGTGPQRRRGMPSRRYMGKPNVGGKEMGKLILDQVKPEYRNKPAGKRTHYAVAGAPGMGKSTLVDFLQKRGLIPKDDEAAHIDPDFIKQGLVGYAGGQGAGAVHYESANSASRVAGDAARDGMDIITEGTGQRGSYYQRINNDGYKSVGHWAFTPTDVARKRITDRQKEDGRRIDPSITNAVQSSTYDLVTNYLKNGTLNEFHLWDTDVPKGSDPKKIAEVVDGVLTVNDKEKFISWAGGGRRGGEQNLSYWQKKFAKK
jgi:predicted ABC-type ATPase